MSRRPENQNGEKQPVRRRRRARTRQSEFFSYPTHLAFGCRQHHALELRYQGTQVFQAIRRRLQNNDGDAELREMLLKG